MANQDVRLSFDRGAIAALADDPELLTFSKQLGGTVIDYAEMLAPKDTGAGAASINIWPGHDSRGWFIDLSWDQDHFYMLFGEFGTSTRPPTPFLEPAVDRYLYLK